MYLLREIFGYFFEISRDFEEMMTSSNSDDAINFNVTPDRRPMRSKIDQKLMQLTPITWSDEDVNEEEDLTSC